jgi:hypothetical protein
MKRLIAYLRRVISGQRYEHTCPSCTFLGRWLEYDLYFCPQGGSCPTVIGRYGNYSPSYTSGLALTNTPCLVVAMHRAIARGLISKERAKSLIS